MDMDIIIGLMVLGVAVLVWYGINEYKVTRITITPDVLLSDEFRSSYGMEKNFKEVLHNNTVVLYAITGIKTKDDLRYIKDVIRKKYGLPSVFMDKYLLLHFMLVKILYLESNIKRYDTLFKDMFDYAYSVIGVKQNPDSGIEFIRIFDSIPSIKDMSLAVIENVLVFSRIERFHNIISYLHNNNNYDNGTRDNDLYQYLINTISDLRKEYVKETR